MKRRIFIGTSKRFLKTTRLLKVVFLLAPCVTLFFSNASGVEVIATKADTFISQAFPDGEFSKSEFLAISCDRNEKTITYIPFEFNAQHVGILPERDIINSAVLTLFVKSLPSMPKSNAIASAGTTDISPNADPRKPEDTTKKSSENLEDKINALEENIIRIEIFGIIDEETFEPNSKHYRVSWNGKNDSTAPKHNNIDENLDQTGLIKIGTIEIDISKDEYEDGDRIEFQSDELIEYLSFCYGISATREKAHNFRSPLSKIQNATIVLRQEIGPSALFFYSSDSLGEDSDKAESGEEADEKKLGAKTKDVDKKSDTTANTNTSPNKLETVENINIENAFEKAQKKVQEENEKKEMKQFKKNIVKQYSSRKAEFNFAFATKNMTMTNGDDDENSSDKEKPDLRPRIIFEFRESTAEERSE